MSRFFENFNLSWSAFIAYLPALLGGILCFAITLTLANFFSKIVSRYSLRRTHDTLIANFIGKIIWAIIFIFGTVFTLGILGLGTISNKILAGAGITTFIVGFALKDIGENFLAGLILAFSRPYRVGSLIECEKVKGIVKDMTLRQTTVEAQNGHITLIPNSMIIKFPLIKHSNSDNNLKQDFYISIENKRVEEAITIIEQTISKIEFVSHEGGNQQVKVIVDSLNGDKVKLLVIYWLDKLTFKGSRSGTRSDVILEVIKQLNQKEIVFSS